MATMMVRWLGARMAPSGKVKSMPVVKREPERSMGLAEVLMSSRNSKSSELRKPTAISAMEGSAGW